MIEERATFESVDSSKVDEEEKELMQSSSSSSSNSSSVESLRTSCEDEQSNFVLDCNLKAEN